MSLLRVIAASGRLPPPPKPAEYRIIPCDPGYTGPGYEQTRVCTLRTSDYTWVCTDWTTVGGSCVIDAFTFVGPDTVELANTGIYDHTLSANGHTARIRAAFFGRDPGGGISYEVWAPTLAGRLCRPHWKAEPPSYKGPESNWQDFEPLNESGYLYIPPRLEKEYGTGPYHNLKFNELNGCNIDIK